MTGQAWRSATASAGGNCAEVAGSGSGVLVRDSHLAGGGPVLRFGAAEWAAFTAALKAERAAAR